MITIFTLPLLMVMDSLLTVVEETKYTQKYKETASSLNGNDGCDVNRKYLLSFLCNISETEVLHLKVQSMPVIADAVY